jgi:hypothetical protein
MMVQLTGSNAALPLDSRQNSLTTVKGLRLCRIFFLTLFCHHHPVQSLRRSIFILTSEFYYFIGVFYEVTIVYALH